MTTIVNKTKPKIQGCHLWIVRIFCPFISSPCAQQRLEPEEYKLLEDCVAGCCGWFKRTRPSGDSARIKSGVHES
jgi:hypothetical protein